MGRPGLPRTLPIRTAVALGAGVLAVLPVAVLPVAPARAEVQPPRQPPPGMSVVGGARLGQPGVQVDRAGATTLPELSALAWMISDIDTGDVLAAKNAHWPLPPASTLKTLFAAAELPRQPADTVHKVTAAELAGLGTGSSLVGIQAGQSYKVSDLWLGVLLRSGNDAVRTLAMMNGGVPAAVTAMQALADTLGARDTRVISPDGYDAPGQVSSAYDLTLFLRSALANPDFTRYAATRVAQFPGGRDAKGGLVPSFQIQNGNRLLAGTDGVTRYPGLIAGKNGYTAQAGNTLVTAAARDGHTLVATVLNPQSGKSNAVYNETRQLLDWGFAARARVAPVGSLVHAPTATPGHDAPARQAAEHPALAGARLVARWGALLALPLAGLVVLTLRQWRRQRARRRRRARVAAFMQRG
ncbi:D-alanyl-D-alanine carboxypeptidase [Kitasatospora herbaricolor]|uniref:D-alanyl-D-alanine carboxypeptidase family protein n=1 Tax=Kitasatospora herbaricolor TaxID=68217 RepID=UPI001749257B|nr:D-alanyl-D-alanine carboxypeptidase [Kitasatospora herbaricolor]MDQ0306592.1 D-alanyl-D-alanine carboxypeptidase (penicillin-binding protein 5/6) [Kitasatospora herbaricolor]GGV33802.1 D-alanyl-D-alanine carboxypeptidase [Kitasatospora herbaricolor]